MRRFLIVLSTLVCLALLVLLVWAGRSGSPGTKQPSNLRTTGGPGSSATQSPSATADPSANAIPGSTTGALSATQTSATPGSADSSPANPYTPVSRETGQEKRLWDTTFLTRFLHQSEGAPIRFELAGGAFAEGSIRKIERRNGEVISLMGNLTAPEAGRFFFQKQTVQGKQGDFAGVVEFPASQTAWRIEPSGPNGVSELVRRRLDQVVCLLPPPDSALMEAEEMPPLDPSDHPDYPIPDYQDGIISLQSLPGATGVLYIDYRGGYNDNNWGSFPYDRPNVSNTTIKDVWKRVAEDYMPFNINVTTDIKVYQAAPEGRRQRCAVTPTTTAAPGAGGVAWIGSWNWGGDTPCWAFYSSGKSAAEVISHEVGHTLQLGHDGRTSPSEGYYGGQGSGAVGWAPIMGVGYYQPVAQWSKGEYNYADNTQDDLAIIVNNNNAVDYRSDDTGATLAASRYLEVYSNNTVFAEGVIETTGDTDAFQFTTTGGTISLTASPAGGDWANLAISATLANSAGAVIASNNPQTQLSATIGASVSSGSYTFRVTGTGRNDPATDGFSSYASLGYYSVGGSVANARQPSRFTVAENTPNGSVVGTISATNPDGDPLVYVITGGNSNSTFAVNNSGALRVANSTALDYETLARNTQFTVQYQLFVNITNTANPSLTELNRRVVVEVLDVNEAPVALGFTNTFLTGTQPGTVIGTVTATDPDYYTILGYSIQSGNTDGLFAIGSQSGVVTVNGLMTPDTAGVYNLGVQVSDAGVNSTSVLVNVRITVVTNNTPFQPGSIRYAVFDGIGSGTSVSDLTNNARFPRDPTWDQARQVFEGDTDRADNYGSVMRGYLIPPVSGTYYFYIASDDNSDLWLGTSTNPASATRVSHISGASSWTGSRQWNKYTSQMSAARSLVAGQGYYIEARQKEGGGGDHLAVGWRGPATSYQTNVIPGAYLAPYVINYIPRVTGFTMNVRRDAFPGARLGRVTVTDANTNDTHTFTILSGNAEGIFGTDPEGYIVVANSAALAATATPSFTLSVRATDSGSPTLSATGAVVLNITAADGIVGSQLRREMFLALGNGTSVADLTSSAKFPGRPDALTALTSFAAPENTGENYGSRVRGYVVPPISGDYRFFIASDDDSQLKFNRTGTNPATATVIASLSGYSDANVWTKFASQSSAIQVGLVAGQRYYIEALHKEGGGGDHLSVGWLIPGSGVTNVIPGANLQPVDLNYDPQMKSQTFGLLQSAPNGTLFGTVTATDSPLDLLAFQIVGGNGNNTFAIDPSTGTLRVTDNTLLDGSVSTFDLAVAVQDSGYGGLFPLRAATGTVHIAVTATNTPYVWTGSSGTNRWSNAGNWGGGVPFPGVRLIFGWPNQQANVNDATSRAAWIQFTNGGFSCGGNPVILQSGLTNLSGNNTWAIDTTLGGFQTWLNSGAELTINGNVTNAGFTLALAGNGDFRVAGAIQGTGGLNKTGGGRLMIHGPQPYSGGTIIAAAGENAALEVNGVNDLWLTNSDLTLIGRMDLWNHNASIGALNGSGTIHANNGTRTLTIGANGHSGAFGGLIKDQTWASGVKLGVVKTGAGTQTFTTTNTYSGGLTVSQGQVTISATTTGNAAGHGAPGNAIIVGPGARLTYSASRGAGLHTGPATLLPGAILTFNGSDNTFASGNTLALTGASITGSGQLRIRGANASSPRLSVGPGTDTSIISVGTATLTGDGGMTTAFFDVADGAASPDLTISSPVSGHFGNTTEGITKTGAGMMRLANSCTYIGPTIVSGGTLQVNGSLGTNMVTVQTGATLAGSGIINGPVSIQAGAVISPGADAPGVLSTRTQTWNAGSAMIFRLNNVTNLSGWARLNVIGALNVQATTDDPFTFRLRTLDGTTPGLLADFNPAANYQWVLATASGGILNFDPSKFVIDSSGFSNAWTGTFTIATNGNSLVIHYTGFVTGPEIAGMTMIPGTGFTFTFSGPPGLAYTVRAGTNMALAPVSSWPVFTNGVFDSEPVICTDTEADINPRRFFIITVP